jgi:preprotein translocase subunit YajC
MFDPLILLAQADATGGEPSPLAQMLLPVVMVAIFYLIWYRPMVANKHKLESLVKNLKVGDRVIVNPGILGTIVGVEEQVFLVRVDDKTRIKVLRSAIAGLQDQPAETEKK